MGTQFGARVDERAFLNLPGFHGSAFVAAYIEDTSEQGPYTNSECGPDCKDCPYNFEPQMTLEIAGCRDRVELEFDLDTEAGRVNSLHKLDTLIAALRVFRAGFVAEFAEYDRRERELAELRPE
jgi:hypothetical protein